MNESKLTPLIIIASNRGPYSFRAKKNGAFEVERGAGGLVTALGALAQQHEVVWVAAAMSKGDKKWADQHQDGLEEIDGIYLKLINPNKKEYDNYYNKIANPLLWFTQHQLWNTVSDPVIDEDIWEAWKDGYHPINRDFAETIASVIPDNDREVIVLVQDYHLYLVPYYLRELIGRRAHIQPFLHIPWPGPDAWRVLPGTMREEILKGMLSSDMIGFQTRKDAFNFVQTCRFYLEDAHSHGSRDAITYGNYRVPAKAYPISIDVKQVEELMQDPETLFFKSQLADFIRGNKLILRVDRVEPSKNILRGLDAFRTLLKLHPEYVGEVQMLTLLVPSRMGVSEYQDYLQAVMAKAGMINAEFSSSFWEPSRIIVGDNYSRAIAAMQLYDVLIVNPIADGMNLVAKEGVLVNQKAGVLVLSEYAGAFYEMGDAAISISPFDVYGTAQAMHIALNMPIEERFDRSNQLQGIVRNSDVNRWFYSQVEDAIAFSRNQDKNSVTPSTPDTAISESSATD